MKCYLCNSENLENVKGEVRDRPEIKIKKCRDCSLVFLDTHEHINDNFYEESGMDNSNKCLSIPTTNFNDDTEKRFKLHNEKLKNKNILDFGCGSADFLFKLKKENISPNLNALEVNQAHKDLLSSNFNLYQNIEDIPDESLDVITLFHVLEHLKDPITELNKLYPKLKKGGQVIIEVPNADDTLLKTYDCEAFSKFTYWSCHLYLFTNKTIKDLINKTDYKIENIQQFQRYPFSNHLYWLIKGKPGGHIKWSFINNKILNSIYEKFLANINQCDTVITTITK